MSSTTVPLTDLANSSTKRPRLDVGTSAGSPVHPVRDAHSISTSANGTNLAQDSEELIKIIKGQDKKLADMQKMLNAQKGIITGMLTRLGKWDGGGETDENGNPKKGMISLAYSAGCFVRDTWPSEFQTHQENFKKESAYKKAEREALALAQQE